MAVLVGAEARGHGSARHLGSHLVPQCQLVVTLSVEGKNGPVRRKIAAVRGGEVRLFGVGMWGSEYEASYKRCVCLEWVCGV